MLQNIRDKSQSTIAKVIVALVVISLAAFGIDAIVGGFSGEPAAAKVNGEPITQRDFQRAVERQRQAMLAKMQKSDPSAIDEVALSKDVLDALINQELLVQDAIRQGVELSDQEVDSLLLSIPDFQQDGVFSQELFLSAVSRMGLSVSEFRKLIRREYMLNHVRVGLGMGAFVVPSEVDRLLALQRQVRSFSVLRIPESSVSGGISVTDEEIAAYYRLHPTSFTKPESIDVAYIQLSKQAFTSKVEVSDAEIKDLYDERYAKAPLAEERKAAHILIEDGDQAADTLAAVQAGMKAGAPFAELAKKYSADAGSADNGGDLGYAGRGVYDPDFEKALFDAAQDEIVGPVRSAFGQHFIQVLDIKKREQPKLEAVADALRQEVVEQRIRADYVKARAELTDVTYSASDLDEPAKQLNLDVKQLSGVTRESTEGLMANAGLRRMLFSQEVLNNGNNTDVVELESGDLVVARVTKHDPESVLALAKVTDQIREKVQHEKAITKITDQVALLANQLKAGASKEVVANNAGVPWEHFEGVTRVSTDIAAALLSKAFSMKRPVADEVVASVQALPDSVALIVLNQVDVGEKAADAEMASLNTLLTNRQSQLEYDLYLRSLTEKGEIKRL